MTAEYELRSYLKKTGFGSNVIQRLCKTSVKKNLYWEIKEVITEETFGGGGRVHKRPQKVRVYGLNSTKDVRARLIEILQERVRYHKDKFIAPIILDEMKHMVVKRSGKVEHSDNSHDDQVFSYLMALYVWYDGKNIAENFQIMKNTIKTDLEEELIENEIDDTIENVEKVDFDQVAYEEGSEGWEAIKFIEENSKYITTEDLSTEQYYQIIKLRNSILNKSPSLRNKFASETGVDPDMYLDRNNFGQTNVDLPNSIYDMDNFGDDEDSGYNVVQGNLANIWNKL